MITGRRLAPLTVLLLASCGLLSDPAGTCANAAAEYGADFEVAGAFATTAERVTAIYPDAPQQIAASGAADDEGVTLCYLDGELPKGPPPDDGGVIPRSFDRAVVAVIRDVSVPLVLGYAEDVPVADPSR